MRRRTAAEIAELRQNVEALALDFLTQLATVEEAVGTRLDRLKIDAQQADILSAEEQDDLFFLDDVDSKFVDLMQTLYERIYAR